MTNTNTYSQQIKHTVSRTHFQYPVPDTFTLEDEIPTPQNGRYTAAWVDYHHDWLYAAQYHHPKYTIRCLASRFLTSRYKMRADEQSKTSELIWEEVEAIEGETQ